MRLAVVLGPSGADIRLDHPMRPRLGRPAPKRQVGQALDRSRGGFSTKIHLKINFNGHPITFDLTGNKKNDASRFRIRLGLGPDIDQRAPVANKGYDSKTNEKYKTLAAAFVLVKSVHAA
ncbi:hypothetical protein OE766_25240 [Pararhizobium sp. YC-54]|uniref:hypothetical protein n=1 Tax=Pararhizobium sp. YC-54 TaxID=2986920 RepID=UPI0021F79013|nr:hypothetical protein [Pararhizobium sp. YC-54]MCW0001528.1 hypothetical protein [Pararhizobium sp. YC-54]